LNAHARGTYPVGNVHARVRGERGVSDHFLAEGQPQKNLRRSDEQQKHDNHECQPLPLPPAPRGDALPDPLLPARGHRARFYTSASTDRYRHVLSICALNVLVFARLTARNGHGVVRQDNGVQRRAFAVGVTGFSHVLCTSIGASAFVPSSVSGAVSLISSLRVRTCATIIIVASRISSLAPVSGGRVRSAFARYDLSGRDPLRRGNAKLVSG